MFYQECKDSWSLSAKDTMKLLQFTVHTTFIYIGVISVIPGWLLWQYGAALFFYFLTLVWEHFDAFKSGFKTIPFLEILLVFSLFFLSYLPLLVCMWVCVYVDTFVCVRERERRRKRNIVKPLAYVKTHWACCWKWTFIAIITMIVLMFSFFQGYAEYRNRDYEKLQKE